MKIFVLISFIFVVAYFLVLMKSFNPKIKAFLEDDEFKPWKIAVVLLPGVASVLIVMLASLFFSKL